MLSGRWFAGDVFPGEVGDVLHGSSFDLKYKDNAEDILGAVRAGREEERLVVMFGRQKFSRSCVAKGGSIWGYDASWDIMLERP